VIEALTRTLWGVRRAATDGVPTEQRLESARTIAADTEAAATETATDNQPPTPNNQGAADGGHDEQRE